MAKLSTIRKKRSKLSIAILFPLLAVVFLVGWTLACIGQSKQPKAKQNQKIINKTPEKEEVDLVFIPRQEEQIRIK